MWFALAAILMLFMGLISAYVVRRGLDPNWQAIRIPEIALINTAVLLASSFTLEIGRRSHKAHRWLLAAVILGLVFVAGQAVVWRQLAEAGFYLDTNAHASFVYVFIALHGLHLLGGILALIRITLAAGGVAVIALYWHFLDGLWLFLLVVLFL
jgi:cytochrome c oxidase subunit 3